MKLWATFFPNKRSERLFWRAQNICSPYKKWRRMSVTVSTRILVNDATTFKYFADLRFEILKGIIVRWLRCPFQESNTSRNDRSFLEQLICPSSDQSKAKAKQHVLKDLIIIPVLNPFHASRAQRIGFRRDGGFWLPHFANSLHSSLYLWTPLQAILYFLFSRSWKAMFFRR